MASWNRLLWTWHTSTARRTAAGGEGGGGHQRVGKMGEELVGEELLVGALGDERVGRGGGNGAITMGVDCEAEQETELLLGIAPAAL